jgi:hypothetical protein
MYFFETQDTTGISPFSVFKRLECVTAAPRHPINQASHYETSRGTSKPRLTQRDRQARSLSASQQQPSSGVTSDLIFNAYATAPHGSLPPEAEMQQMPTTASAKRTVTRVVRAKRWKRMVCC